MDLEGSPRPLRRPRRLLLRTATLTVALLSIPVAALATHVFSDVPHSHPHAKGIGYVSETGVTQGCDGSRYCPGDGLTRAQMGTFLYRASGNDPDTPPSVNAARLQGQTVSQLRSGVDAATVQGQTASQLKQGGNAASVQDVTLLGLLETSIPVSGLELTGSSTRNLVAPVHERGVRLAESLPSPGFAATVTLPLAKPASVQTYLDVSWNINQTNCSVSLRNNAVSVRRAGSVTTPAFALVPDGGPSTLLAPGTANQTVVTRYRFNSGSEARLTGGDSIVFGMFRSTAGSPNQEDTCTQDMIVTGLAVRYG